VVLLVTLHIDRRVERSRAVSSARRFPVVSDHTDFEGIAFVAGDRTIYLSSEKPPGVVTFRPGDPAAKNLPLPAIFSKARKNLALRIR